MSGMRRRQLLGGADMRLHQGNGLRGLAQRDEGLGELHLECQRPGTVDSGRIGAPVALHDLAELGQRLAIPAFVPAFIVAGVIVYIATKDRRNRDGSHSERQGSTDKDETP